MRPTPIPTEDIWEGAERRVIGPPGGDLTHPTIASVEALVDFSGDGVPRVSVRCQPEGDDLDKLTAGGHVWITFYGAVIPFSVDVKGPRE